MTSRFCTRRIKILAALILGLFGGEIRGAALQGQSRVADRLAVAQRNLSVGQFSTHDVYLLAQAGARESVPALKEHFVLKKDVLLKGALASALVRLGAKEPEFWNYLVQQATKAAKNDAPSLFPTGKGGRLVRGNGKFAPDFEAWALRNGVEPSLAAQEQLYMLPNYITFIGITGDPRAAPLLRKALATRNFLVQVNAARGLAKLKDHDAIAQIARACESAPPEMAQSIATALVFFDEPRAQEVAAKFITNKQTLERLRKRAQVVGADPFLN